MTDTDLRRGERGVHDPDAVLAIIRSANICRVGFVDDGEPYIVPLNFGFEPGDGLRGGRFWFHSAVAGRKIGLIAAQPRVCVQLEDDLGLVDHPRSACAWTQMFRSVIAWGTARAAADSDEACHGLDVLMRDHSGRDGWTYPDKMLDQTLVWCVEVDRLTAKEHVAKAETTSADDPS